MELIASDLYKDAFKHLQQEDPDTLVVWKEFLEWLSSTKEMTDEWDTKGGKKLASNIQEENSLVESRGAPHGLMVTFMTKCARIFRAHKGGGPEIRRQYLDLCREHFLKGEAVKAELPDTLIRYVGVFVFVMAAKRLDSTLITKFNSGEIGRNGAIELLSRIWGSRQFEPNENIGPSESVFSTFDHDNKLHAKKADEISRILALPIAAKVDYYKARGNTKPEPLFRLRYPKKKVEKLRCPTIADAQTFSFFTPSRRNGGTFGDMGLSDPMISGADGAPELVHENISLNALSGPLEFVGFVS